MSRSSRFELSSRKPVVERPGAPCLDSETWVFGKAIPFSAKVNYLLAALLLVLSGAAASVLVLRTPNTTFAATNPNPTLNQPDVACRTCHQAIYDSYQKTSMAQGSGDAKDFAQNPSSVPLLSTVGFLHAPSGITYRIAERYGRPVLTYYRPASTERPALTGEHPLSYFVGSGKRGRTYLYGQENFWFEVPINWYGKKKLWDMAPAFENATSMPDPLPVDANCLHCHTGDVQQPTGARNHFPAQPFRAAGVGCAACHGDPTAHLASSGQLKLGPILNPAHLSPPARDSICLQCHLEGDATVYLPGKALATFTPGQPLSQSALYFVDRTRAQLGGRASSQYEALLRSACMRAVGDKLTCTTCHDPHSSPAPEQRVAFFRAKCLTCHTAPALATAHHPEQQDCAVCHMPTRKTLDISHEQLTDHDIEAHPTASSAPLTRRAQLPELVPVGTPTAGPRELGLAYAQLAQRASGNRLAGERALTLLQQAEKSGSDDPELHTQLGYLLQLSGNLKAAATEYTAALRQNPQSTSAAANLAVLVARTGNPAEAIRLLTQAVAGDPAQTPAALNLAFLQCRVGRKKEALQTLTRALLFNPDNPTAQAFLQTGTYGTQSCPLH